MPSSLYGLARQISEYARQRYGKQYRSADDHIEKTQPSEYVRGRRRLLDRLREVLFGREESPPNVSPPTTTASPPPSVTPPPVDLRTIWPGTPGAPEPEPDYDDIQLLGRDAGYDQADFDAVMAGVRRTEGSSNVYGYYFERESRKSGILYVTFLGGRGDDRKGPGPTYAYYDVSVAKANQFQRATAASAGNAVWDYLRIRGTVSGHQHQYRLIHAFGDYVPRKATPIGFRNRAVPNIGIGRRGFRRNTLPAMRFSRGNPDRGMPDRGQPDRG